VPAAEPLTGRQFLELVFEEAGHSPKIGVASRPMIRMAGLFNPLLRELNETLYQFERPFVADASKFQGAFGPFETTPIARRWGARWPGFGATTASRGPRRTRWSYSVSVGTVSTKGQSHVSVQTGRMIVGPPQPVPTALRRTLATLPRAGATDDYALPGLRATPSSHGRPRVESGPGSRAHELVNAPARQLHDQCSVGEHGEELAVNFQSRGVFPRRLTRRVFGPGVRG
jgi:hypothetical protein